MRLYSKVIASIALTSVFAGHGIIVHSRRAVHRSLLAAVEEAGVRAASESAGSLAAALPSADERRILPLLQSRLQATGGVYAFAVDPDGRVLGHSNVAEVGGVYRDARTLLTLASLHASAAETEHDGRTVLDLAVPLFNAPGKEDGDEFLLADTAAASRGGRVGTLRIGIPLNATSATERSISTGILRGVLLLGGVTGALLFFFVRRLLAPIGLLSAATSRIRSGDYRGSLPVTTDDEIGALARSFNEMSRALGQTTVSKDFFNDILDSIQDQVIVTDAAGVIVLVNPAVVALLGWTAPELIGRPGAALLDGPEASFVRPSRNIPTRLLGKSGDKPAVLFSSSPIRTEDGRITGHIGAIRDVRELRRLEARMHQSEKLSAVGQLAAGVAHEINNPLGVILGFAQALAPQLRPDDGLELPIRSIEREALRCKALVQNLLTFARTDPSERVSLDLSEAVEQALVLIAPQARMSKASISTDLARDLPSVLGNKNELEQVVINLAKNALDAMPPGGVLALSTSRLDRAAGSWVCLRVVDGGTGIPSAVLSRIFDPVFTTKAVGQGTGLGLSLVNEIIQKHSGEISVESRPGRTEFLVKLPIPSIEP